MDYDFDNGTALSMFMKVSGVNMTWMEASAGYRTASASIQVMFTPSTFMNMAAAGRIKIIILGSGGSIISHTAQAQDIHSHITRTHKPL